MLYRVSFLLSVRKDFYSFNNIVGLNGLLGWGNLDIVTIYGIHEVQCKKRFFYHDDKEKCLH